MPPSNAMENDKKRLRNQFTKDERTRLLTIMTEYGPLLDDKNISILSRKEIWEIIENKFNENGHSGRTSAQLKKYWQNYKYHSKRTKVIHKEVPKPLSPMTKHMVRMLAKVDPDEWAQYDVAVNATPAKNSPGSSKKSATPMALRAKTDGVKLDRRANDSSPVSRTSATPPRTSSKSSVAEASSSASDARARPESSGIRCGVKSDISESNVVVSTTDVPGSSVTVSVICPEVSSKARTIFWKRNTPLEKVEPATSCAGVDVERVTGKRIPPDRFGAIDFGNSDPCNEVTSDPLHDARSGRLVRQNNYGHRLDILGMLAGNRTERTAIDGSGEFNDKSAGYQDAPAHPLDDHPLVRSAATPCQKSSQSQPPGNETKVAPRRGNKTDSMGNAVEVTNEMPTAAAHVAEDSCRTERLRSLSTINGGNDTAEVSPDGGVPNPSTSCPTISRDNARFAGGVRDEKGVDVDCPELNEIMRRFAATAGESSSRTEIQDDVKRIIRRFGEAGNDYNFVGDSEKRGADVTRCFTNRNKDSPTRDFPWSKFYLTLLRGVGQSGENRRVERLGRFEPLISAVSSTDKGDRDNEESSDSDRAESEPGMEVDECNANPEIGAGRLRVRRVSSIAQPAGEDEPDREIKVETEAGPGATDAAQDQLNDGIEDNRVMNSMDYLVQAKLRSAKSELDHQLKLQKLEMEEKELRVRIAEMTIQETKLRIRALVEERLRATEIHQLRIAQMDAEKARAEAEHAARMDASRTTTAESRARISSIERDRERSENFYQMQLRRVSAGSANGNCSVNSVKRKQY